VSLSLVPKLRHSLSFTQMRLDRRAHSGCGRERGVLDFSLFFSKYLGRHKRDPSIPWRMEFASVELRLFQT
jgi:hypothetical protein